MTAEVDTRVTCSPQIESVCRRFVEALRSGETIDGVEDWLLQVPEPLRPELKERLRLARGAVNAGSVETSFLSSDAVLTSGAPDDFSFTELPVGDRALAQCRTFRGLSAEATVRLTDALRPVSLPAGTVLLEQGTPARGLYLLISGSVDVIDSSTGERIDRDGAGSVLGEMSLLTGQLCSAGVIATSDVEALVLSTESYHRLIASHPELEIALSQLVSDRLGGRAHDALCGKEVGGYRLIRCLNRGGMGVVYQAESLDGGQQVALKMLRHRFIYDAQMQARFEQEAQLLTSLQHPNIISLRSNFLAYRTRFLVLDLCDGADLYQLLRSRGPFDVETTKSMLGQIAAGLSEAHRQGIVHRDLKPGNVLVDHDGRLRIVDFGLSRLLEAEGAEAKAVGTPGYMPPEQFRSEEVVCESDWYSLGCVAYELLTGEMLFPGHDWLRIYTNKSTARPSSTWPVLETDPELAAIIRSSIEPNAADRRINLLKISGWAKQVPQLFP